MRIILVLLFVLLSNSQGHEYKELDPNKNYIILDFEKDDVWKYFFPEITFYEDKNLKRESSIKLKKDGLFEGSEKKCKRTFYSSSSESSDSLYEVRNGRTWSYDCVGVFYEPHSGRLLKGSNFESYKLIAFDRKINNKLYEVEILGKKVYFELEAKKVMKYSESSKKRYQKILEDYPYFNEEISRLRECVRNKKDTCFNEYTIYSNLETLKAFDIKSKSSENAQTDKFRIYEVYKELLNIKKNKVNNRFDLMKKCLNPIEMNITSVKKLRNNKIVYFNSFLNNSVYGNASGWMDNLVCSYYINPEKRKVAIDLELYFLGD